MKRFFIYFISNKPKINLFVAANRFNLTLYYPPKPYVFALYTLKGELLNSVNNSSSSTNILNIFNVKLKKDNIHETKKEKSSNYVSKPRHYPPANKEWYSSIYAYNDNVTKLLPVADKVVLKLVKSYFNFYSRRLEKKIKSRLLRIRARKLSTNRILVSKAELKHTNDKVIVTIYVYNRQKKHYLAKINRIATMDQMDNFISDAEKTLILKKKSKWPSVLKMKVIKKKSLIVRSKINKQKAIVWKTLGLKSKADNNEYITHEKFYLKHYVAKCLRKEMLSVYFRQLISFNKSKFEDRYLLPLTSLVRRVYNRKVEFNLVNIKYLYLNSYIFSNTIVTKLRNRNNRLLTVLNAALLMFKLPSIDRLALYDEIYNRKKKLQNLKVRDIIANIFSLKSNVKPQEMDPFIIPKSGDLLELLLSKMNLKESLLKVNDFEASHFSNNMNHQLYIIDTLFKSIKNKFVSGIRLEVAGRLTRRNTAARSLFKKRYSGNIKNMDSSYKGLPTVLLRGFAKSNLQYTKLKSKIRIGSFGLKGWVSSS